MKKALVLICVFILSTIFFNTYATNNHEQRIKIEKSIIRNSLNEVFIDSNQLKSIKLNNLTCAKSVP